jgi:hypothetical protein
MLCELITGERLYSDETVAYRPSLFCGISNIESHVNVDESQLKWQEETTYITVK